MAHWKIDIISHHHYTSIALVVHDIILDENIYYKLAVGSDIFTWYVVSHWRYMMFRTVLEIQIYTHSANQCFKTDQFGWKIGILWIHVQKWWEIINNLS